MYVFMNKEMCTFFLLVLDAAVIDINARKYTVLFISNIGFFKKRFDNFLVLLKIILIVIPMNERLFYNE